jgi:hypothetical protein
MKQPIIDIIDKEKLKRGTEAIKCSMSWWSKQLVCRISIIERFVVWYYEAKINRLVKSCIK